MTTPEIAVRLWRDGDQWSWTAYIGSDMDDTGTIDGSRDWTQDQAEAFAAERWPGAAVEVDS